VSRAEEFDPSGLIRESYRIEGIGAAECRTILLEWLLKLPEGTDLRVAVRAMLEAHAGGAPGHPMSALLRAALQPASAGAERPRRRGGAAARRRSGAPER